MFFLFFVDFSLTNNHYKQTQFHTKYLKDSRERESIREVKRKGREIVRDRVLIINYYTVEYDYKPVKCLST